MLQAAPRLGAVLALNLGCYYVFKPLLEEQLTTVVAQWLGVRVLAGWMLTTSRMTRLQAGALLGLAVGALHLAFNSAVGGLSAWLTVGLLGVYWMTSYVPGPRAGEKQPELHLELFAIVFPLLSALEWLNYT